MYEGPTYDPGVGRLTIGTLAVTLLLGGCARETEPELPAACRSGAEAVRAALAQAPEPVTLAGTRLSECLGRAGETADIQQVGGDYLEVATVLAADARRDPEGRAALRLGYLVGAVRRGAASTQGFHSEIVRRIEQETLPLDTRARAFRAGERAGRAAG